MNTNLSPLHAIKSVPVSRNLSGIDNKRTAVLEVGNDEAIPFIMTGTETERSSRNVTFGCITALFLAVVFAWVVVTVHQTAFAKSTVTRQASSTFEQGMAAWHKGDIAAADRLMSDAYAEYASSGYPVSALAEISSTRAQINAAMGNTNRAKQLSMQAHEFAAHTNL